jgi:ABC-2 type transport system ATP-binding protein
MIRGGKLVAQSSLADFTAAEAGWIQVRAADGAALAEALERDGAAVEREADGALKVSELDRERIGDLALRLDIAIYELAPQRSSLEERFIELMDDGEHGS